jgi:hypothetical protein
VELLKLQSDRINELIELVKNAASENPNLRCAVPYKENLIDVFPCPQMASPVTVIAADGSQIIPSRHRRVEFGAINIGAIRMTPGSGNPPLIDVRSRLLSQQELFPNGSLISEGGLNLLRDMAEREVLVEIASSLTLPAVTLTDGPLELFRDPESSAGYDLALEQYLNQLDHLRHAGASPAGYVDKPRSDLVVRLLDLASQKSHPDTGEGQYRGLSDALVYKEILKNPGERSAVFGIQSPTTQAFTDENDLYFYYLNVGRERNPSIVRVEVPAWVVNDEAQSNLVHATLIDQCRMLGSQPYPYVLHRAHEIAVISYEEIDRLEEMIIAEMLDQGTSIEDGSAKQAWKNERGRTRYGK